MNSISCDHVHGDQITIRAGSKKNPHFFQIDVTTLCNLGPVYFSNRPKHPCYVDPKKRELLRRYLPFLTPENIRKYLVEFVKKGNPCTPRRIYYICTNFCRKHPEMTTYQIQRRDAMSGEMILTTIVLWDEYTQHLHVEPRCVNDFFQRRKRQANDKECLPSDVVLCRVSPTEFVVTSPNQIVFLNMIHTIRLLDQVPRWLDLAIAEQYKDLERRNKEVAKCKKEGRVYRRRALNPVKLVRGAPLQSY
jgi:hypothetical protein